MDAARNAMGRVVIVCCLLLSPVTVWAQSSISGVARDTSGGVLPGVTVEAGSPALIQGVRAVVTDQEGRYQIVDLRPGAYTVTFTLGGFKTLKREGIELQANFTATVDAELSVGALEETVTVSGEAPVVDIHNVRQQAQFTKETLESLPGTGRLTGLAQVIPGATVSAVNSSVGGVRDLNQTSVSMHGAPAADPVVDGMSQRPQNLGAGVYIYNQATFQEVVVDTSAVGADRDSGGMTINIVARDGGNTFAGLASYAYAGPHLESSNINDELVARHLNPQNVGALKKFFDTAGGFGGPLKRDKLWFFGSARANTTEQYQQGNYWNKLKGTLLYQPDSSRQFYDVGYSRDLSLRLTLQAMPKHKIVFTDSIQPNCNCRGNNVFSASPLNAPEATAEHHYNPNTIPSITWTSPLTNRILLEAGVLSNIHVLNVKRQPGVGTDDISVLDQGLNLRYGSRGSGTGTTTSYVTLPRRQIVQRFGLSYVTGSHLFKTGFDTRFFKSGSQSINNNNLNQINHAISYRFRNGVPNQVTIWATPLSFEEAGRDIALYAQDQWTIKKVTLNLGVRYNDYKSSTPEQVVGAGFFVPQRIYAAQDQLESWRNLGPRLGVAYDLFGTGKTAIKASLARYPSRLEVVAGNPTRAVDSSTSRTWNDTNGNYVPDCDLRSPAANGECGVWSNLNFGNPTQTFSRNAADATEGFNLQDHNWQGSVSLQHELRPGVGLNVGYFRTWYAGFLATDNQLVTPANYDQFCITVPVDNRLPTSGQQLCGLYDIKPASFGVTNNLITQASHYGTQTQAYNGLDVTIAARFGKGGQVSGGASVGRTVTDNCFVVDSPQQARPGFCHVAPPWSAGSQVKFLVIYPLPWDLQTSLNYQNNPGVNRDTDFVVSNAAIAPSLGRNLGQCGAAAVCNANVTIALVPPSSTYEPRVQQVDLRFSRILRLGGTRRVRGNFDIYNIFNASAVVNMTRVYGTTWLDAIQVMGGRLVKVGAQIDF